jgi:hypothetical protein
MSMTRLQICQRIRELAGIPGSGPSTTIGQTGELGRVVNWADSAWATLQARHNWQWMWEEATVTILAGANTAAGTIAANRYVKDATYNGSEQMQYQQWDVFRVNYPSALIADGTPTVWTIKPDMTFALNAKPTANVTLNVERYRNPTAMTADADVPDLPEANHMAIVYQAMILYANFEEAAIVRATALEEYRRHLGELGMSDLPEASFGAALC